MVTVFLKNGKGKARKAVITNTVDPVTRYILVDFDNRDVDGFDKLEAIPLDEAERKKVSKFVDDAEWDRWEEPRKPESLAAMVTSDEAKGESDVSS
jgi:hypothetical protein